jgi:tetratricopeptide (TPR) repeat protein
VTASASAPLLSAAMIVRDEEHHLPACLDSLEGVADEVVVVDTGSSDRTREIAHERGARVIEVPWRDDFAQARNASLDAARGQWVLYIDADERLRPIERRRLDALLTSTTAIALRVLLRPFARASPYREYRVWRNDPRIRFRGIIHEQIISAIHAVAQIDGRPVEDCALALDHVGYDGDQHHKHRRNLPLLRAQLAEDPDVVFNWRHLAGCLAATGQTDDAIRALERAIEVAGASADEQDQLIGAVAWADLVRLRHGRGEDVRDLLSQAPDGQPDNWHLLWTVAAIAIDDARYADALPLLERLGEVDVESLPQTTAYDVRIFGSLACAQRGLCLFRLGRYAEAAEAYRVAERHEPDNLAMRVKRQLAEARARSHV